jgi:molybdopterin converting factor small subunit
MAIATKVKVKIPAMFQSATGGVKMAEVTGRTIGECLKALSEQFPGLKRMLYDEGEQFSGYLNVMVNGQSIPGDLNEIPVKAGDELYPLIMIEGG